MLYSSYMIRDEKSRRELGEQLKEARLKVKLTQAEVANLAGIHVNYYARCERGKENPSFEVLQGIMKALKIKSLDLF